MRQSYYSWITVLLIGLLASACSKKRTEEPQPGNCSIPATVQYQTCRVLNCAQHPTLLILANGQQLKPAGPAWDHFWSNMITLAPQQVRIDYQPLPTQHIYPWTNANIICICESSSEESN
jgi:hypothetical protein